MTMVIQLVKQCVKQAAERATCVDSSLKPIDNVANSVTNRESPLHFVQHIIQSGYFSSNVEPVLVIGPEEQLYHTFEVYYRRWFSNFISKMLPCWLIRPT